MTRGCSRSRQLKSVDGQARMSKNMFIVLGEGKGESSLMMDYLNENFFFRSRGNDNRKQRVGRKLLFIDPVAIGTDRVPYSLIIEHCAKSRTP